jgi:hypothetical protein
VSLLLRALVFVPVVFLVMVVYVAPKHDAALPVLRMAVRKTGKVLAWTLGIALAALGLGWLFI